MNTLSILPIELLHEIASHDIGAYNALLSVPTFVKSLTSDRILDYKIAFKHSIKITAKTIEWYQNNKRHRKEGPALEYHNGAKQWYQNGELHRKDGPAIENSDGKKIWFLNDKIHRDDGPAIEYPDGKKEWYQDGLFHRTDGPAVELPNGQNYWYNYGKLHRIDYPFDNN